LLNAIKKQARDMNDAFVKYSNTENPENAEEQFVRLGEILELAKKTNIQLEESITNEYINSLFELLQEFVTGSNIIGAGSGGYIVGWLKKGISKEVVSEALKQTYPDAQVTDMTLWIE
jgi:galactokinase/mevalonate kinase-like predicted kinase